MNLNRKTLRRMILKEMAEMSNPGYVKGQVTNQRKANQLLSWASNPPGWMDARGPEVWEEDYDGDWEEQTLVLPTKFYSLYDRAFGQTYQLQQDDRGNSQYHPQIEPMALEILDILEGWHSGTNPDPLLNLSKIEGVDITTQEGEYITGMTIYADFVHPGEQIAGYQQPKVNMESIRKHIACVIDCIKSAGYVR